MSRNNPIPTKLREKFVCFMAANDDDDLPDGAWFATLESAAQTFMHRHGLTQPWHCCNAAAHQYIRLSADKASPAGRTSKG